MEIYKEFLSVQDKHFITLFETDEYSKLMGEVSAMQLTLKKKIEKQLEKSMKNLPLINRTEMDELYKTIHELKKRINMLEKQIDNEVIVAEEPKAAKKTAKNA
jgi:phosphate uptake regulator